MIICLSHYGLLYSFPIMYKRMRQIYTKCYAASKTYLWIYDKVNPSICYGMLAGVPLHNQDCLFQWYLWWCITDGMSKQIKFSILLLIQIMGKEVFPSYFCLLLSILVQDTSSRLWLHAPGVDTNACWIFYLQDCYVRSSNSRFDTSSWKSWSLNSVPVNRK
jgi:hypothetical protein